MSQRAPRDLVASTRDRLKQLANKRGENFEITLIRYAVERFLYRLSHSQHRARFILKGAMLFTAWGQNLHRPTRDLDLLGSGENNAEAVRRTIEKILATPVEPDGLDFDAARLVIEPLHEGQDYEGVRASLAIGLGNIRIPLQIDIAFGQAVEPEAEEDEYPGLLEGPSSRVWMYPREVVVAEKFQALVRLGVTNNRLKDFHDIAFLADTFDFSAERLTRALRATFERRGTPLPETTPLALTKAYFTDPDRLSDWRAFLGRAGVDEAAWPLAHACAKIEAFAMPAADWAREKQVPASTWIRAAGWR